MCFRILVQSQAIKHRNVISVLGASATGIMIPGQTREATEVETDDLFDLGGQENL